MDQKSLDLFRSWGFPFRDFSAPTCELEETHKNYVLKFEIPGVKRDQVKVDLEGSQLTVSAERKEEQTSDTKRKHYSEFRYGSYSRSFTFPTPIDESKVDARFEDGVLSITVPKTSPTAPKQIKIQ